MQGETASRAAWRLTSGLGPRLRLWPWMIVVAVVAVVSALVVRVSLHDVLASRPLALALISAGWAAATAVALAGLTWAFDRPGHARRWRVLGVASLAVPLAVLVVDLGLAQRLGELSGTEQLNALVLHAVLLLWAWRFVPALWPARCPECRAPALIPVPRPAQITGDRDDDVRECAECQALFRRSRRRGGDAPRDWVRFEPRGRPG